LLFLCSVAFGVCQSDYQILYEKGKAEGASKDYPNAFIDYTLAISIDANRPDAYYQRGISSLRTSHFKSAVTDFTKVIELESKTPSLVGRKPPGGDLANSYFYRAEAEFQLYEFEEAVNDYSQALKKGMDSVADAYNGRGRAKKRLADARQGSYSDAIRDFDKGLALEPTSAFGYYHRGTAEYNAGNYAASLKDITNATQLDTTDADKYYWLAMAQSRLKNYTDAQVNFTSSIRLDPFKQREYEGRAMAELALGKIDDAHADMLKAVEIKNGGTYKSAPMQK